MRSILQGLGRRRHLALALPAALAALALAGCIQQAREVAVYRAQLDRNAPSALPVSGTPLTLLQALAAANAHNERLAISGEDYLQALIGKDRAAAAFLPALSLQPSYFRMDEAPVAPGTPTHALDVPAGLGMNVFNGFRDQAALRAASANAQARQALLLDLQATVLVETAQVYYHVLSLEAQLRVIADTLTVNEARVRLLEYQLHAGLARRVDLEQARAQAAETRVLQLGTQAQVVQGRATLALLLGLPAVPEPLVDGLAVPAVETEPALEAQAVERRYDLAAAVAGVQAATQGVTVALGRYYPSVRLDLNYYLRRQSYPSASDWNGVLSANLPIFNGGEIHADVRAAWSRLRQARLRQELVQRQIAHDVQVAHNELLASGTTIEQLRVQVAAARQGAVQARESYRLGTGTALENLVAQNQVLNAELRLASEEYRRKIAYLTLLRVTGALVFGEGPLAAAAP